jgi:uncharacterized protein (TIGR02001 family)
MSMTTSFAKTVGAAGIALLTLSGAAAAEERAFSWSVNAAGTSDYIFRGVSQSDEKPAASAGLDVAWGIAYAGIWASTVDKDFVGGSPAEIDFYAGIKPVWGPATFDFGVLYYYYPGSDDGEKIGLTGEPDVVELKIGVSGEILPKLSAATYVYWSPEAAYDAGEYWVSESTLAYALPNIGIFAPSISGTIGFVDNQDFESSDYTYWNAGLALAVEKFTFDFRYWDTDISEASASHGIADERFVFTAKIVLP